MTQNHGSSADTATCTTTNAFNYSIELVDLTTQPTITSVEPAELLIGQSHYLWISGVDFVDGAQVAVNGTGVVVGEVTFVDSATLGLNVTVDATAEPGARDVTVTNPNGIATTMAGAITLVAALWWGAANGGARCAR